MSIINKSYKWNGTLSKRPKTNYIVLHHAAAKSASADDIHRIHLNNGWCGIGYHFYVRKDGSIYRGRPIDTIGAHATNFNAQSIGICFEGNFETDTMSDAQFNAGREVIEHAKKYYPSAKVVRHKDLSSTLCPGKKFPFDKVTKPLELTEVNDIVWELAERGIITDKDLWLKKLEADANSYWLARKCANYIITD